MSSRTKAYGVFLQQEYGSNPVLLCPAVPLQADEGPVEEGGISEAQGAGGEEQERSTHGGGQKERGQHVRELPASQGEACVCVYVYT